MVWTDKRVANKYGAKSTTYGGYTYHSKLEAGYAQELDLRKHASNPSQRVQEYERQFKVPLYVNGYLICTYYVDFRVTLADGSVELVEVKGFETEIWRLKRKLLEAVYLPEHPEVKYIVVR